MVSAFKQTLPTYAKLKFTKMGGQLIKDRLLKYEDQIVRTVYKFGVLYCREGQTEEDQMYNNGAHQISACLLFFSCQQIIIVVVVVIIIYANIIVSVLLLPCVAHRTWKPSV